MSLFDNMLSSEESLFKNEAALDYEFLPKKLPFREAEQESVAAAIKPLFVKRTGRNLIVHGPPGVGKTAAIKHVLRELEEKTEEIMPIYINCWQKNTSFKILCEICDYVGYKFVHNKKTDELFNVIERNLNQQSAVFVFDEIDKAEDFDFLYSILERIMHKTVILLTNYKEWVIGLDERIKSRLMAEMLPFSAYNEKETRGILAHRLDYAFAEDCWDSDGFMLASKKTAELKDIRSGLYILKEAGQCAEERASRRVTREHVLIALDKLDEFMIKKQTDLEQEAQFVLDLTKKYPDSKIGDLYEKYKDEGGKGVYKTFQRRIEKLQKNKFVSVKKHKGGSQGSTTIVSPANKKITEF